LAYFSRKVKAYAITSKRTIIKSGLIGTDFQSIVFDQIKNVFVSVGIMGKIFNVGTIKIDLGQTETHTTSSNNGRSSSTSTNPVYETLSDIDNPYEVYKYFQQTLEGRKESLYSGAAYKESHPEGFEKS